MDAQLDRIVIDPEVLSGKPHIQGTRISVEFILELLASGATHEEILRAYPHLQSEDIEQAILYALRSLKNDVVIDVAVKTSSKAPRMLGVRSQSKGEKRKRRAHSQ